MTNFTKEQLRTFMEAGRTVFAPLVADLARFALMRSERAEDAEAINDKLGKSLAAAMEALGEKQLQLTEAEDAIRHADKWWQETYHDQQDELDLITGNKIEPCEEGCEACNFEKHPAVQRARERGK